MSKEQKHIDDLFKDELKDVNLQASLSDFDAIMQKMNPPKKKRPIFIWFLVGAIGLSLLTWGISSTVGNNNQKVQRPPVEGSDNINQSNKAETNDELGNTLKSKEGAAKTIDEPSNLNLQSIDNSNKTESSKWPDDKSEVAKKGVEQNYIEENYESKSSGSKGKKLNEVSTEEQSTEKSEADVKQIAYVDVESIEDLQAEESSSINTSDTSLNDSSKNQNNPSLPLVPLKSGVRLELMSSYLVANHSLSSNDNYASIRENGESAKANINIGIRAYKDFGGLSLGSGLEFHTYTQEASYRYERKAFDWIPVLNPLNDTIGYFRSNFRDTTEEFVSTNKVSSVRVPLTIGYNLNLGKQGIRFIAGLNGEIITRKSGVLPGKDFLVPTSADKEYSQDFLFGWNAEIGYFRKIGSKLNLEVRSYYGSSFNSLLGKETSKDKPNQYGIGIGVSYNLGL